MFLPTTKAELDILGWNELDVILVSGDAYIDSPYIGVAVIGKVLVDAGFKVGIIAQPNLQNDDIKRLGQPRLFWGVSGGSVDSMVANYTANKKFRNSDDYTPGGKNNKRPDRAVIAYTNLIKQHFKDTAPIVLGGIEASLRRITHYDFWSNKLRRPILFDAKADILLYGMAEASVLNLAKTLDAKKDYKTLRGLCYIDKEPKKEYLRLPSFSECQKDKVKFIDMFDAFYQNNDPLNAKGLCQQVDTRFLIQNPPEHYLSDKALDKVYDLRYERKLHPFYQKDGDVKALHTIKFSVTTHQGCWGECNFCAIGVHQGRRVRSRTKESIINEVKSFTDDKSFKGIISDVGGATANMYGFECDIKLQNGACKKKACSGFVACSKMEPSHQKQIDLLQEIRAIKGVKKAFVASGIRYDLINNDKKYGKTYLKELVTHHISGQMKIAPEHTSDKVLKLMNKPSTSSLVQFKKDFDALSRSMGKKQFLTYYLIAAHPGCSETEMRELKNFTQQKLHINPEQAQIFTPTPSTYSSLMYYTELDPKTKKPIFVEKDARKKEKQKEIVVAKKGFYAKKKR
jgi:uncharacterized radical SAM protein YgiQ